MDSSSKFSYTPFLNGITVGVGSISKEETALSESTRTGNPEVQLGKGKKVLGWMGRRVNQC